MRSFTAVAAVAFSLALSATSIAAQPPKTLPTINVPGVCQYGDNCVFMSGNSLFLTPIVNFPPDVASIGADEPLTATCQSLRDRALVIFCDTNNPPPAPYFPSPTHGQWQSNGCGAGRWYEQIAAHVVLDGIDGYTGDLDEPLVGISFASACAHHDNCYYSGVKSLCDLRLGGELADECLMIAACGDIAAKFQEAVLLFGQAAYNSDHHDMECAKVSKDLRDGQCVS